MIEAEYELQWLQEQQDLNVTHVDNQYGPIVDATAAVLIGDRSCPTDKANAKEDKVGAWRIFNEFESLKNASAPGLGMESSVLSRSKNVEIIHELNVNK